MAATEEKRLVLSREVYMQTTAYAREHGELDLYRLSEQENESCKNAIEVYINSHYKDYILNMDGVGDLVDNYGTQRMAYVLANTLRHKNHDGRFSPENKRWAETIPLSSTADNSIIDNNSIYWVVQSHPALLNMFINTARDIITAKEQEAPKPPRPPVADDITDLRLLSSSYDHGDKEYIFSCLNRGEPDTLTYFTSRHNGEVESFFYTQKDNIWERMDANERREFDTVLYRAATFGLLEREINSVKSESDMEVAYIFYMETDPDDLSEEQWDRITDMMDKKREELSNLPENGTQEDNPSKEQDSLNQKAVRPKQPKI